jgi:hypothetical protein
MLRLAGSQHRHQQAKNCSCLSHNGCKITKNPWLSTVSMQKTSDANHLQTECKQQSLLVCRELLNFACKNKSNETNTIMDGFVPCAWVQL